MRELVLVVALAVSGLAPAVVGAEPSPVRASLVADRVPGGPGDAVRIGAVLTLEPGWHVYWANPGEAGLATEVTLEVPAGWEVGPLEWPVPIAFTQPGEIAGYGYEGSVLLARTVRAGAGSEGGALPVRAHASWLACKDICVLGEARLEGELGGGGVTVEPEAFARRVMPLPQAAARVGVSSTRSTRPGELAVWLQWPQPPGEVEWFPAPTQGLQVEVGRLATRASLTRVDLALRRVGEGPPASQLTAVVVVTDRDGRRTGYDLELEVE